MENIIFDLQESIHGKLSEPLQLLFSRYSGNLEKLMKGHCFIFDSFKPMYCKCHKVTCIHGDSYIHSSDWIKKKKTTIIRKRKMVNVFNRRWRLN